MANEHAQAYCDAFSAYFRGGENAIPGGERALKELGVKAAMIAGSEPDGGFTVRPEMETTIDETLREVSRCARSARSGRSARQPEEAGEPAWYGHRLGGRDGFPSADRRCEPLRTGVPGDGTLRHAAASQALLDDSFVDIGSWLASEVELEFAAQEGAAFIAGDGSKKPRGIIGGYQVVAENAYSWGKLAYVPTGASGGFASTNPADALVDLYHSPKSAYRTNANWIMNRKTMSTCRKLKDGQATTSSTCPPHRRPVQEMLGRRSSRCRTCPTSRRTPSRSPSVTSSCGYLIVDRIGIRVLRDPYTAKPYVLFYTTKRVGGGVQNFEAIRLLKIAAS